MARPPASPDDCATFAISCCRTSSMEVSMDGRGRWMDNRFIERLWRSLKYEDILAGLLGRAGYWTGIGQMVPAVQHATASPSTAQRHAGAVVSGRGRLWRQASRLVVEALVSREAAPSRSARVLKPNHEPGLTESLVCAKKQMDKTTNQKGASNDLCVPGSFRFKWIRKSCRSATGCTFACARFSPIC